MRYDSEHKQKTREKVLQVAAKAIRTNGPDRVAVAGIMAEAGLTHGGFYAHFASKDALVAAAIGQMFAEARARMRRETEGRGVAEGLSAYIDFYLSKKHRDARSQGCPIAAMSSDLPRLSEPARAEFAAGVQRQIAGIGEKLAALERAEPDIEAHSVICELLGALSLARIEPSAKKSDAMLTAARQRLKQRLGLETRA